MKNKVFVSILILVLLISPSSVFAERPYLTKEWSRHEGQTYYDAIDWTNYLELDDGYIIASVGGNGYASLRKISKDGKNLIWSKNVNRGLYFGDMHYYKDNLYITSWDGADGTSLLKMDSEGNQLEKIIISSEVDNDYAYAGESFLHGNMLYFVYKSLENDGESDTDYGPEFIAEINLDTLKIEKDPKNFYDYSSEELDYITEGKTELISEKMKHIYSEYGYTTYIAQEIVTDKYKYYSGSIYNDDESIGIVIKADFDNNIIWMYKPGKDVASEFYDMAYIGNDMIAVGGYIYDDSSTEYISSVIRVMSSDGEVLETHNLKDELGDIANTDLIVFNNLSDGLLGQVVAYDNDDDTYQLYTIKYSIAPFDIEKEVKGEGSITVKPNALAGDEVEFIIAPGKGYMVKGVSIINERGEEIVPNGNKFIMPTGNVKIIAEFVTVENPNTGASISIAFGLLAILCSILIVNYLRKNNKLYKI